MHCLLKQSVRETEQHILHGPDLVPLLLLVIVFVSNNIIHSQFEVGKPGSECPLSYLLDTVYLPNLQYCHPKANGRKP